MRQLTFLISLFSSAVVASADEEVFQAAGGKLEELRVVLDLDASQAQKLRDLLAKAAPEYESVRKAMREKGVDAARDEKRVWQDRLRDGVREILTQEQKVRYGDWLERKRQLADEYDKALFGIPTVTEMKLRLGIGSEACRRMQRTADEGVDKIRKKVLELKNSGAKAEEIAKAVNDLRRTTIERMIEGAGQDQKKVKEFVKAWLQTPEAKLSKGERDRLNRVMKELAVAEPQEKRVRGLVAAVLMHREENGWLRKGMGKEVLMSVLRGKKDAEVWSAMNEYGALIDVHARRLTALFEDLKAELSTKQIGKLVAEGILE